MGIIDKMKQAGAAIANAAISPLLEKPKNRITWKAYGKWRTFTNNDGVISFRRSRQKPQDTHTVASSVKARDKALEEWGIAVNSRGGVPPPIVARPVLIRPPIDQTGYRMQGISRRLPRITPRTPRLRR